MTFRQKPSSFDLKSNAPTLNLYSAIAHLYLDLYSDLSLLIYHLCLFVFTFFALSCAHTPILPPISDLLSLPRYDRTIPGQTI